MPDDNSAKSFRLDTEGIDYVSLSDGDVSIKQGIGAAIPSIANTHGSCYVHQLRTNIDVINGKKKEYVDAGKVPVFHSDHDDEDDRKKDVKRQRAKFLPLMQEELLAIKFCSNQDLGVIMFDDNQRLTVPSQLDRMMDAGESYTREEVEKAGVSPMPVIYGSHRQTTTHFALETDIGMLFLGTHTKQYNPLEVCQRQDRMVVRDSGLRTKVYMLRGIEELEQLASEVKQQKETEGGLTDAEILKNMFERHLAVQKASKNELEAMMNDLVEGYKGEGLNDAEARSEAINDLHEDERRFVLCTPIDANLSQDHVQVTEPFRSMPTYTGTMTDRNVVYKWRCKCERFLKYGFCGNVFYLQHCKGWEDNELQEGGYFNTTVPAICYGHDPGEGRGKGRPLNAIPKQQEGMKPN